MADITGANLTGAQLKTGSQEASKEEGPLSQVPVIGETLEKINPFK